MPDLLELSGRAYYHVPVIMDGFISAVAALAAVQMCNKVREYIIVSHVSKEPGMHILLKALGREASMTCDMCLGEGTGAVHFFRYWIWHWLYMRK